MGRHPIRRALTRFRYRVERYFYLLLVVVAPLALIAVLVVGTYLMITRDLTLAGLATVSLPPVLIEAWGVIDPYLSREAEIILIGTLILGFLVMVAYIADRRTE